MRPIPTWILAVGPDDERVCNAFERLLSELTLTRADLGRRMGLGPSTVGNWASGSQRPSLGSMEAATETLSGVLSELEESVDGMQAILRLVDQVIEAFERNHEERTKESFLAYLELGRRLTKTLDDFGVTVEGGE